MWPRLRHIPSTAGRSVDQTVRLPVVYEEISYRAVCIRPSCTSLPVASYPRSESGTRCTDDYPLASADIVFGLRGTWARMVVPCSGLESIESKPSTNFIRSVMLVRPSPCPPIVSSRSKPTPESCTLNSTSLGVAFERHLELPYTTVLHCSVANYTRRFEGLASRSIVGNRVMEAVPVTGIPPWDRGMGQGEMRIFRFDLGKSVRVSKHKPRKSRNAVGQVGKPWGSFSPRFLRSFPPFPHARVCAAERERELGGRRVQCASSGHRVAAALTGGCACIADDLPHRALHPGGEINAGGFGGQSPP